MLFSSTNFPERKMGTWNESEDHEFGDAFSHFILRRSASSSSYVHQGQDGSIAVAAMLMSGYYNLVLKQSQAAWKPGWKGAHWDYKEAQRLHCLKRREIKFPGKTQQGIYLVWESLGNSPLLVLFTLRKESRYTARYWFWLQLLGAKGIPRLSFRLPSDVVQEGII